MQTEAQGQLQAAEVRQKGLKKQLAEQRKALASKEKEAGGLAQTLQKEQQKVDECSRRQAPLNVCIHRHLSSGDIKQNRDSCSSASPGDPCLC